MRKITLLVITMLSLLPTIAMAQKDRYVKNRNRILSASGGYYKELFMDGGIGLTSRRILPSAAALSLDMEFFATAPKVKLSAVDTLTQQQIFCGYEQDTNGWLLYPDGAPRYRVIYVNGGSAATHARSLTSIGRSRIVKFVEQGGSYLGTCAGAYLATAGSKSSGREVKNENVYLHLWEGVMHSTGLRKSHTALRLKPKNPLLRYYDFGGDMLVDSVYHNGGGYALDDSEFSLPIGTQPLAYYVFKDDAKVKIDNQIACWAYKRNESGGRVVLVGSHPEKDKKGEKMDFMSSLLLYAMDGNGAPKIKGELRPGELRQMNKSTEDGLPDFTVIGDRQYHHFRFVVPKGCKSLIVSIDGYPGRDNFDLALSTNPGSVALLDDAQYTVQGAGCTKRIVVSNPKPGSWFASVFCITTVSSITGEYGTEYFGRTDVLNGVPYSIKIQVE